VHKGESELTSRTSYRVGLRRQERVGETLQPEEVVLVNIRREPLAVRLEWPEGPNKGREVIYDKAGDGLMHINMPGAIVPRMSLAPDSPMVVRSSRHPIQDAGLETVLQGLSRTLERHASRQTEPGETLHDGGVQALDPDRVPCRKIIQRNAKGETWTVGLDPSTGLPLLVLGLAPNGDLLERHQFFKYESNPSGLAEATAFVPSKRWGEAKGLIPRLPLNLLSGQPVAPDTERK
jgi:hypothetical protein